MPQGSQRLDCTPGTPVLGRAGRRLCSGSSDNVNGAAARLWGYATLGWSSRERNVGRGLGRTQGPPGVDKGLPGAGPTCQAPPFCRWSWGCLLPALCAGVSHVDFTLLRPQEGPRGEINCREHSMASVRRRESGASTPESRAPGRPLRTGPSLSALRSPLWSVYPEFGIPVTLDSLSLNNPEHIPQTPLFKQSQTW